MPRSTGANEGIVDFVTRELVNPETSEPFTLYEAEERFLREAFTLTEDGSVLYPEVVFSGPKKSGKTAIGAWALLYSTLCLGGRYAEGYTVANDYDQPVGRVFRAAARMVEASPRLRPLARVLSDRIEFPDTGGVIQAIASDYASAAGGAPTCSVFDELWGYVSERSRRLWDEMVPVPTRKVSMRFTVSYAGFQGESELLEELYKRGLKGQEIAPDLYSIPGSLLMYWTHDCPAPWQTERWKEQMRGQLRRNAYLRMIENRFVSGESEFLPIEDWDACVDPDARPVVSDKSLSVWVGVDASVKKDSTAIVATTWDREAQRVRLAAHRKFQPSPTDPLDFEATVERTLLDFQERYDIREVRYDPYQMVNSAQRLQKAGVPMREFPQTSGNLTEASQNLYDLVMGRNLVVYRDSDLRSAIQHSVALETSRGWRISKEKTSHKIDLVVALAQAALGAVQESGKLDLWYV